MVAFVAMFSHWPMAHADVRHKAMGLNAAVYADDDCEVEIASLRIGNVSTVGHLHERIIEKWPTATVLLTKVLGSGSHCGDFLAKEEVQRAKLELEEIRRTCVDDEDLKDFIVGFGGIVDAALEHDRPLTFT